MSYGLIIRNTRGEVTFTSVGVYGGVYAGKVVVPYGVSLTAYLDGSNGYPDIRGLQLRVFEDGIGAHNWQEYQGPTPYIIVNHRTLPPGWVGSNGSTTLRIFAI